MQQLNCRTMMDVILRIPAQHLHRSQLDPCKLKSTSTNNFLRHQAYCYRNVQTGASLSPKESEWEPPELQKLHEDDWILAISKPGSILVHNTKDATREERQRRAFLKDLVEAQHSQRSPMYPVHRLDRGASGVILFAKCGVSAHATQLALAHEDTVKEYLVLARGSTPDSFICEDPVNDEKGISRSAWTKFDKLLDLPKSRCSLLKVYIKTGRWHQIRKHLNHLAFHVVGDGAHGKGRTNQFFRDHYQMPPARCFLHAARLTIPHPSIFSSQKCVKGQLPSMVKELGMSRSLQLESFEGYREECSADLSSLRDEGAVNLPLYLPKAPEKMQIEGNHPMLTLHASLPADLSRVLLALPDGISCELLQSLDIIN